MEKKQRFDSDDPDILAAYQAETNGDYSEAIKYYKKAIERDPNKGIVYKHCGNVFYRIGRLGEAVGSLEKAAELLPQFPTVRYELGLAYYRQVRILESIAQMKKVLELDEHFLMAHYWLGILNYHYGHLNDAKKHYEIVTQRNPDFTIAFFHLGTTNLRLGLYKDSIKALREVIKSHSSPAAFTLLGEAYLNLDEKFEARKAFKKALEIDPDDRKAIRGLRMAEQFDELSL